MRTSFFLRLDQGSLIEWFGSTVDGTGYMEDGSKGHRQEPVDLLGDGAECSNLPGWRWRQRWESSVAWVAGRKELAMLRPGRSRRLRTAGMRSALKAGLLARLLWMRGRVRTAYRPSYPVQRNCMRLGCKLDPECLAEGHGRSAGWS